MDVGKFPCFAPGLRASSDNNINIVRALHQTVIDLRVELEKSKAELARTRRAMSFESPVEEDMAVGLRQDSESDASQMDYRLQPMSSTEEGAGNEEEEEEQEGTSGEDGDDDSTTVDDIELIFTTDEVKELPPCTETLVSISDVENEPGEDEDKENREGQPVLLKYQQEGFDTLKTDVCKGTSQDNGQFLKNANHDKSSCSRQKFLPHLDSIALVKKHQRTCHSDLPSKYYCKRHSSKSGKKILKFSDEETALWGGVGVGAESVRPILTTSTVPKRESGAQTLITAIPKQWKSENYLAHRFPQSFTTLPSKFSLPGQQKSKFGHPVRPSTVKPRALLSDLNFTSMVPEFTRSADRLNRQHEDDCKKKGRVGERTFEGYFRTGNKEGREMHLGHATTSGMHRWHQVWVPEEKLAWLHQSRNQCWASVPSSPELRPEMWKSCMAPWSFANEPTTPSASYLRRSWSSMPSSYLPYSAAPVQRHDDSKQSRRIRHRKKTRVSFRGSLPNLSSVEGDSGGSTDSLLDEAEEFVRSSIDMLLSHEDWESVVRRRKLRRRSEPDTVRGFPLLSSRPFLPKSCSELKASDYVKIIHAGGRVAVGRVCFTGVLPGKSEPHVGVELQASLTTTGVTDGTFEGRRYFECEPGRAVFVPFKKVILAWSGK